MSKLPKGWKHKDVRKDGRQVKEDGAAKKLKNDPHNPERLLKRKRESSGDGFDQKKEGWTPTAWNDSGAGKGDNKRPIGIPEEVYGYRYDLATGRISVEEFNKLMEEYNSNEMG